MEIAHSVFSLEFKTSLYSLSSNPKGFAANLKGSSDSQI